MRSIQKGSNVTLCWGASFSNTFLLQFPFPRYCSHSSNAASISASELPIKNEPPGTKTMTAPSTGRIHVSNMVTFASTVVSMDVVRMVCVGACEIIGCISWVFVGVGGGIRAGGLHPAVTNRKNPNNIRA